MKLEYIADELTALWKLTMKKNDIFAIQLSDINELVALTLGFEKNRNMERWTYCVLDELKNITSAPSPKKLEWVT